MTSRSPSSAQSMANSNANSGGSRMNMLRLLGHGRSKSIDRAAAASSPPRTKPRSSMTTTTPTIPASASATMGFRSSCFAKRVTRALKRHGPLPRSSLGNPVHQLASWWLISIRADFTSFYFFFGLYNFIVLARWVFFLKVCRASLTPSPCFQQHYHLLTAFRACTQVEIGLYCTVWSRRIQSTELFFCYLPLLSILTSHFVCFAFFFRLYTPPCMIYSNEL